ncbi:hypothetical protein GCM10011348_26930 [Marinobacterium nitratireducens]|uniref:DUF5602 domain-containing protein n=1 Tax=Marinobacterium nitratireducens TaxID=518897 RepID=A0A918DV26_9GAMM|nr:hypothetical protein [Marinobacterium nitratireducens]GGO83355.1 hypothetical protein GCM10011348_26930 [Marinobacterium nitratireducens]
MKRSMATALAMLMPVLAFAEKPTSYEETAPVALGDGHITAFGAVENGVPQTLGVRFDDAVFDNAPTEESDGYSDILDENGNIVWHCCGHERSPTLPRNIAETTRFEHIVLNWNPVGHPPPTGIYRPPHIDFHFYTVSEFERIAITPPSAQDMCGPGIPLTCEQFETATRPLPPGQHPAGFISPGAVEPRMGNHLLWSGAPELNGGEFTHTWIYGTWNGYISFWEPMITREFLQSHPNSCFDIPALPTAAKNIGWFPTEYCVEFDEESDQHFVYLTAFTRLGQSKWEDGED